MVDLTYDESHVLHLLSGWPNGRALAHDHDDIARSLAVRGLITFTDSGHARLVNVTCEVCHNGYALHSTVDGHCPHCVASAERHELTLAQIALVHAHAAAERAAGREFGSAEWMFAVMDIRQGIDPQPNLYR